AIGGSSGYGWCSCWCWCAGRWAATSARRSPWWWASSRCSCPGGVSRRGPGRCCGGGASARSTGAPRSRWPTTDPGAAYACRTVPRWWRCNWLAGHTGPPE
ncbi:hypothetical protein NJB1728e22_02550, partial [Mycobacterium marinum]